MITDYKKLLQDFLSGKELILVSNRGPYSFELDENGKPVEARGGGGLVSALLSLLADIDVTWLSVARTAVDSQIGLGGVFVGPGKSSKVKFLNLKEDLYSAYYDKMCNEVFWFIQHGLADSTYNPVFNEETNSAWRSYSLVNKYFGEALARYLEGKRKKTIVMFQDYHLYLAASSLRRNKDVLSCHFTHIPWPAPETMSILPGDILKSVARGLLSNDLIGFHCQSYVSNFLRTCEELLGFEMNVHEQTVKFNGRPVKVAAFPISIDARSLAAEGKLKEVLSFEDSFASKEQIVFRADRVDPSKNIIRGFLSFERMLELFPDLHGKVTFLAYLYESRKLDYYRRYLQRINETVRQINSRFGTRNWQPVKMRIADNYWQTLAAYKHFDVLLVNSIADGMNLVAKEGSLLNQNNGVLVLSTNTGAFNELSRYCLGVNPFDINETALSLREALAMPRKKRENYSMLLKDVIRTNNSAKWLYYQLRAVSGDVANWF